MHFCLPVHTMLVIDEAHHTFCMEDYVKWKHTNTLNATYTDRPMSFSMACLTS